MYGPSGMVAKVLRDWEATLVRLRVRKAAEGESEVTLELNSYPRGATSTTPSSGTATLKFEPESELRLPRASVWGKALSVVSGLGERGLSNVARIIIMHVEQAAQELRDRIERY